eukprot:UN09580
MLCWVTITLYD